MAQAPAHRGIRVLGPEHGGNIVESCLCRGTDIDVHHPTLTRGCLPSRLMPQSPIMIIFLVPRGCGRGMPSHLPHLIWKSSPPQRTGEFDCCGVPAWLR